MKLSLKKNNTYQDIKNIIYFKFLFFLSIVTTFYSINMPLLMASISNNGNLNSELIKSDSITLNSDYIVDTGDILNIDFEGIPIFSRTYNVDFQGFLYIPEIYKLEVKGMTIIEIESLLKQKYREFIKEPVIRINLASPREVNIFIHGEVAKPGLYSMSYGKSSKVNDQNNNIGIGIGIDNSQNQQNLLGNPTKNLSSTVKSPPKLYQAIQKAKGVNNFSDLTNIQIIRNNSISQGGGKIKTSINLLSLLRTGDQSLNIELRDGDTIFIPKSKTSFKKQYFDLSSMNLNPDFISIYLNGNLNTKGLRNLPVNSSLNDAIAFGGGRNFKTGKIRLIRLEGDNSVKKLSFNYRANAKKGSRHNPYLITGDIVVVDKNLIGKTNTILSEVGSPLINAYGILSLFD